MIFEGEFFSGGHLRGNFGWPTPNYAGAFLAALLALAFVFSGSRWRWAILVVETGGLYLLAKTYSRGAVIAWGVACLFCFVASRVWNNPTQRLLWTGRALALVVMLLAAGFGWSRMVEKGDESIVHGTGVAFGQVASPNQSSEASATEDGSIYNRLALWRGGLEMIAAAPLHGWGAGESGRAYMNWFQDVNRTEGYTTMVNSYLHVGVEHGLPILVSVVFGLAALLMTATSTAIIDRRYSEMALATGASLVAWAVANLFTTLWIEPKLWIVPGISCGVIVLGGWHNRSSVRWRWVLGLSAASTVLFAGGLFATGVVLRAGQAWRAEPGDGRTVVVCSNELSRGKLAPTTKGEAWQVWPDTAVLGPTPGKELRRWIETLPIATRVVVHPATQFVPVDGHQAAGNVVLFGWQAERLGWDSLPECRQFVLIHPRGMPPTKWTEEKTHAQITVLIPAIDETGDAMRWRRWATEQGVRVIVSSGVGQDIRAAWPEAFEMVAKDGKEHK
jgi:hypothetical protein